jgi:hypothetical protein
MVWKPIIVVLGLAILMVIGIVAVIAQTTNTASEAAEQSGPDNSCLFNSEQDKCRPDPTTGQCPPGFNMNGDGHCFPNMPCPKGFENHDQDETGTCYPVTTSTMHNNVSNTTNSNPGQSSKSSTNNSTTATP